MTTSACNSETAHRGTATTELSSWFGTLLMYGGVALLIIAGIDRAYGIPFPLPDIYYANESFWPYIGIAVALVGFGMLKRSTGLQWQAAERGQRFDAVVVYTRQGCQLCDEAVALLQRYSRYLPGSIEVDIDDDPRLKERFNTCVPVVEFDGKIRFRGHVNEQLLRRLIEGTKPLVGYARKTSVVPGGT